MQQAAGPAVATGQPAPVFRVTVVSRTIPAINYQHRAGSTHIDFQGTELLPRAKGEAKVDSRMGSTKIEARFDHLSPATQFGPEYLTYVMWAITPEGRPVNLGEVVLDGDHSKLLATTSLQAFGLMVTAEPYFAVTQPSDAVVIQNVVRGDTTGTIQSVEAKYKLLKRGSYVVDRPAYRPVKIDPKGPLQLAEAENAVEIARLAGAETYAPDTLQKAVVDLGNARDYLSSGQDRKAAETTARAAAQMAEDARVITYRKIEDERQAAQRAAARHAREEAARQSAAAETARAERAAAEQAKSEAEAAAGRARAERAAAEQARAAALQQQQQAQSEADRAQAAANQALGERDQMRQRLLQQLNAVMETRETARGLIVNINDVLFDFNKYTLKQGAREKLAKVAGILLAYPGLTLRLEGHTDSVGSDQYNLNLSEERAGAVRAYLVNQGVPAANVTSVGLGEADPVASNGTAAGRQQNRRVELVVSGGSIGVGGSGQEPGATVPAVPAVPQAPPAQQPPVR